MASNGGTTLMLGLPDVNRFNETGQTLYMACPATDDYFLKLKLVKATPIPVVNSKSLFLEPGGGLDMKRLLAVTFQFNQLVNLVVSELSKV